MTIFNRSTNPLCVVDRVSQCITRHGSLIVTDKPGGNITNVLISKDRWMKSFWADDDCHTHWIVDGISREVLAVFDSEGEEILGEWPGFDQAYRER